MQTIQSIVGLRADQDRQDADLLRHEILALLAFVEAGYGGIFASGGSSMSNIDSTWQTLVVDSAAVTTPRNVTQDTANDGIRLDKQGIWVVNFSFVITHNELNSGRTMQFRLRNDTAGATIGTIPIFVGRNAGGTNFAGSFMFDVPEAVEGDLILSQVNSVLDTFSSTFQSSFSIHASHVSNAQAL